MTSSNAPWVIMRRDGEAPAFLTGRGGGFEWTRDIHEAISFSDMEDAERFAAATTDGEPHVVHRIDPAEWARMCTPENPAPEEIANFAMSAFLAILVAVFWTLLLSAAGLATVWVLTGSCIVTTAAFAYFRRNGIALFRRIREIHE